MPEGDASPDIHSYLRFHVQGLNGRRIARVRLSLYANTSSFEGLAVNAIPDNGWDERAIIYKAMPPLGKVLAVASTVASGQRVILDVSSYVRGDGIYSFGLTSRESGANAPQLIVDLGD